MNRLVALLIICCVTGNAGAQGVLAAADSLGKSWMMDKPGLMAVGIIDNDRSRMLFFDRKGAVPAPDSMVAFELGGLSEAFTCILYADMVLRGQLGDDDPLRDFLPMEVTTPIYEKVICRPARATGYEEPLSEQGEVRVRFTPLVCLPDPSAVPQPIRLCYLGTHTSGLPYLPDNMTGPDRNPYAGYTIGHLYDFIRAFRLENPIGFDYRHSELGIALLAHALERKAEMPFAELLSAYVLDSLGMRQTGFNLAPERMLPGFKGDGSPALQTAAGVMAPAVGMQSTLPDMMKFLAANVSRRKQHVVNVLDYTHNPRIMLEGPRQGTEIALGWKVTALGDSARVVWNAGMTEGFSAWTGFNEANHTGVVILSSTAADAGKVGEALILLLMRNRL